MWSLSRLGSVNRCRRRPRPGTCGRWTEPGGTAARRPRSGNGSGGTWASRTMRRPRRNRRRGTRPRRAAPRLTAGGTRRQGGPRGNRPPGQPPVAAPDSGTRPRVTPRLEWRHLCVVTAHLVTSPRRAPGGTDGTRRHAQNEVGSFHC